jgi:hypothetical protein
MPKKLPAYLLPSAQELALLNEHTAKMALEVIDKASSRRHTYALFGMACGTLGLISSTAAFAYLVHDNHPTQAYVVLGTNVIGLLAQMIRARLES